MLIQNSQLNMQQLTALDNLTKQCKQHDKNLVAVYRHLLGKNRERPSNILFFEDQHEKKLIGFLGAFFFQENTCEIALMVAPDYRRQGIATTLLNAILPLLDTEKISELIFTSPQGLQNKWFRALGLDYQNSEFQMRRDTQDNLVTSAISSQIHVAKEIDIPDLCHIDGECFNNQRPNSASHFHTLLHDANLRIYIISHAGKPVGKAHIHWQFESVRMSDIAILPSIQGQGLGTALLEYCINEIRLRNKKNIILDVETQNQHALNLYTRLDFKIDNAHDYWRIDKFGLTAFLTSL